MGCQLCSFGSENPNWSSALERDRQQKHHEEARSQRFNHYSTYDMPRNSGSNKPVNSLSFSEKNYQVTNNLQNQAKKPAASVNSELYQSTNSKNLSLYQISPTSSQNTNFQSHCKPQIKNATFPDVQVWTPSSNFKSKFYDSSSDSSSDSSYGSPTSTCYFEIISYILSYNLNLPKSKVKIIPNSFQDSSSYSTFFENAFFIEINAILEKALEEAFLSCKYRLNLKMNENFASISPAGSSEMKFENEIQINDIVIIIPNQNSFPTDFEEIESENILWTLGLINQGADNKFSILLNTDRKAEFMYSRKYIVAIIGNITSLKREFSVLDKFKRFSMLKQILCPQAYESLHENNDTSRLNEILQNKKYNKFQVKAITNSINSDGKITLIQGPPGTGKTTTVVGILSGLFAKKRKTRIFVCAQSNAAVDEIASTTLKKGIFDLNGNKRADIKLLRIGEKRQKHEIGVEEEVKTAKEVESSIHSIKLNVLVEEKLKIERLYDPSLELKKAVESLDKLEKRIEELKIRGRYDWIEVEEREMKELTDEIRDLKKIKWEYFTKKKEYKIEFIKKSDVIFCTLSGSGSMIAVQNIESIDHLIIDEACQSLELSTLIPFQYNPKSVILIGDPKQLPATTFSEISKTNNYDRSFFERMMECNIRPVLLSQQYRMIKEISDFTSKTFYKNQIKCDRSVIYRKTPNWIYPTGPVFFNIETSREMQAEDSLSYYNESEADFVLKLYALLRKRIYNTNAHIGIISPYKGQVHYIEDLLYQRYGGSWKKNCEVSSVDGFQGREVDLVILSTVRSQSIGFLRDERRMNVAISRAKYGMYAVGNEACLSRNPKWRSLIEYCQDLGKYESCNYFKDMNLLFNRQTYY